MCVVQDWMFHIQIEATTEMKCRGTGDDMWLSAGVSANRKQEQQVRGSVKDTWSTYCVKCERRGKVGVPG